MTSTSARRGFAGQSLAGDQAVNVSHRVAAFGVPSAAGAFTNVPSKAPAALRAAGLLAALGARGIEVTDGGDERHFPSAEDPEHPTCRNVGGVIEAMSATAAAAARSEGVALMIGGDCSLLPGLLAGTRRRVGADDMVNIPHGAIAIWTLCDKLAAGLQQLMAGARKFSTKELSRDDLLSANRETEKETGIPFMTEAFDERAKAILTS